MIIKNDQKLLSLFNVQLLCHFKKRRRNNNRMIYHVLSTFYKDTFLLFIFKMEVLCYIVCGSLQQVGGNFMNPESLHGEKQVVSKFQLDQIYHD